MQFNIEKMHTVIPSLFFIVSSFFGWGLAHPTVGSLFLVHFTLILWLCWMFGRRLPGEAASVSGENTHNWN